VAFAAHGLALREYAVAPGVPMLINSLPVKRLAWLLLAAFCTALAQVQPVDLPVTKHVGCCCEQSGACGMPDCSLPPALPQPVPSLQAPAEVAQVAAPLPRGVGQVFYVLISPRPASAPAWDPSVCATAPASVPLFREHCSLLL
jgi:hypothetical protein